MDKFLLKEAFNQYFHSGCKTHTKRELLAYGNRNEKRIKICLEEWQERGFVPVLKPMEEAKDTEVVVKVLGLIDPEEIRVRG